MKKLTVVAIAILCSQNIVADCLVRANDPRMRVRSFEPPRGAITIDFPEFKADCPVDAACRIYAEDTLELADTTVTWKRKGVELRKLVMELASVKYVNLLESPGPSGQQLLKTSPTFMKSKNAVDGYDFYLLHNGSIKCKALNRYANDIAVLDSDECKFYTLEAFRANADSGTTTEYVRPDDVANNIWLKPDCPGPLQPGTGGGSEPPP